VVEAVAQRHLQPLLPSLVSKPVETAGS